eukprot:TRINITY_DN15660_c3_g1_i1.p1 TRINITY_DN15660_c3_g1~~TRINITY_DN15660_c3_g1_i1.p1  ORF type:complete len:469 (+),score=150.45 TRINITY_DN15660_c3_g1_i1:45-1451(+)
MAETAPLTPQTKYNTITFADDKLIITETKSKAKEGETKEKTKKIVLANRQVYGAEYSGKKVFVRFIKYEEKKDVKMTESGLPAMGQPWYRHTAMDKVKVKMDEESVAKKMCEQIREWASPRRFNIHVIANPNSGKGKGSKVAKTVMEHAAFSRHSITLTETKGAGEATQIAKNLLLDDYSIVAAVGGDGTMCECIEGLMQRADARKGKFTICYIPAGSANAVAHMTGQGDAVTATWSLLKGETRPLDLFQFQQKDRIRYGTLSVTSALIADIDIDSEMCRCMGPVRFVAYAVAKLLCCYKYICCCCTTHHTVEYPMRVRWLPHDDDVDVQTPPKGPMWDINDKSLGWKEFEGDVMFFQAVSAPALDQDMKVAPTCRLDDGKMYVSWMTPKVRCGLIEEFDNIEDAKHLKSNRWTEECVKAVHVELPDPKSKVVLDGESCETAVPFHVEILPGFLNVVVGTGDLPAFSS